MVQLPGALGQMYPPKAKFTEKELSDQAGKVFIVTGGTSGVGAALSKILYDHNATVYIAGRSEEKAQATITSITNGAAKSTGALHFLALDLNDLTTIKASAEAFLAKEKKLDVLWNNAGVMVPPQGSKTAQGYELQLGTNCLAHWLFTMLLTPLLVETAKTVPKGDVRVVWVSSSAAEFQSPKGGVDMTNLDYKRDQGAWTKYGSSKAGDYLYAVEYAKIHKEDGIVSVALNPGNLRTELSRHLNLLSKYALKLVVHAPIQGAHTELFAGLSPEVTLEKSGSWIIPWGRFGSIRKDLADAGKSKEEGGNGNAKAFWDWTVEQVKQYM